MDATGPDDRLSRIKTHWSLVFQAHHDPGQGGAAQHGLLLRYYGAVYRYLLEMLRDPVVAEELTQEFAVRFLRGDFSHADPQRGRFRDFLKVAVRHLVIDYWRHQGRENANAQTLPADSALSPASTPAPDPDAEFLASWREELLVRTWEALAQFERDGGGPYDTVLRAKTARPEARSAELAAEVGTRLAKPMTEAGLRQTLHRAREKFAVLLLDEVVRSMTSAGPEELDQELVELGLLDYCRPALERRRRPG